jgi:hypothetical protein
LPLLPARLDVNLLLPLSVVVVVIIIACPTPLSSPFIQAVRMSTPSRRSFMCLVITINDKGINVIDLGRLRSQIKDANILCQGNTSCVPTPEPTHSTGFRGRHSCTPVHTILCTFLEPSKIRDFLMPLLKRCIGVELYTNLVFSVGIRLVFLGIYQTKTGEKLSRYLSVLKIGANPFFPSKVE